MEAKLHVENPEKWGIEQHDCVDDSDFGAEGYCVNGKCQGTKGW